MADLRSKFIEDYAGGLLNVSRQELASTGEVLSQDGLLTNSTIFVEDGAGTKSGLLLGSSLCEVVDPTTEQGVVNVRYADRTYASIRDLKIFSTAIASAQAALADASASSITNLENAFELLEDSVSIINNSFDTRNIFVDQKLELLDDLTKLDKDVTDVKAVQNTLSDQIKANTDSITAVSRRINKAANVTPAAFTSYGSVVSVVPLSAADSNRVAGTYTLTGLESSLGSGLDITIVVGASGAASITSIDNGGSNFSPGETITIADSSLGNGGADDLVISIVQISEDITSIDIVITQVKNLIDKVNEIISALD